MHTKTKIGQKENWNHMKIKLFTFTDLWFTNNKNGTDSKYIRKTDHIGIPSNNQINKKDDTSVTVKMSGQWKKHYIVLCWWYKAAANEIFKQKTQPKKIYQHVWLCTCMKKGWMEENGIKCRMTKCGEGGKVHY